MQCPWSARAAGCWQVRAVDTQTDISQLNTDISQLNTDISQLKTDISQLNTDISQLKTDIPQSETDIAQSETDISQSAREGRQASQRTRMEAKVVCSAQVDTVYKGCPVDNVAAHACGAGAVWRSDSPTKAGQLSSGARVLRYYMGGALSHRSRCLASM